MKTNKGVGVLAVLVLFAMASGGCKTKDKYSSTCKRGVDLTSPWSEMGLPVADGRVCASDDKRTEVQYLSKHKKDWEDAYAASLTGAGFAKDRCSDASCTFKKADQKATVQVLENATWITVIVRK